MEKLSSLKWSAPISVLYYIIAGMFIYTAKLSWDFSYTHTWVALSLLFVPVIFIIAGIIFGEDEYDAFANASIVAIIAMVVLPFLVWVVSTSGKPMFRAQRYYNIANQQVNVVEAENANDVFPALIQDGDTSKVPLYSEEEAYKKSKAELAKETALESQIAVKDSFITQDLNGELVYVGETRPRSFFKRHAENQYYTINRNTGKTAAFSAEEFKYMNDKYFSSNAERFLKKNFGQVSDIDLELDDNGKPYYVASVIDREFFGGYDVVEGIIVMDPETGKVEEYNLDEVPSWVDRVYPEDVLMDYIRYYGRYANGWSNSVFAQKNVIVPTSTTALTSYEVVYIDGEAYLWTGMTTANADGSSDSNGIMLASLKTGEITYYKVSGVSEQHAMNVVEGLVQEKGYTAGYPIPLKVNDIPAMFMIMRDENSNITGYSLVSYADYTKSAYSENLNDLVVKFLSVVGTNNTLEQVSDADLQTVKGQISNIASEVVDGRTVYYLQVENQVYSTTSVLNVNVVFAKVGDTVEITFVPSDAQVIPLNKIKL